MSVLLALLYPVVVYSALKPGIATSSSWEDGNYQMMILLWTISDDDDEIVHLREMDRWPGLLSDSLDISECTSEYIHSHVAY